MGIRLIVHSNWSSTGTPVICEFQQTRIVLGRATSADVRLPHPAVSAHHATIRSQGPGYAITDEGSTNGTYVGGRRITPQRPKRIETGDVIDLGGFRITIELGAAVGSGTSAECTTELARRLIRDARGPSSVAQPALTIQTGDEAGVRVTLPPSPARIVVGRDEACAVVLADPDASREHVEIKRGPDGSRAIDLGSKNGTLLNDRPLRDRVLRDGDVLTVGATRLLYADPADRALADLDSEPDQPIEPPATATITAPVDASETPPVERKPSPKVQDPDRRWTPDVVIYLFAFAVLVASVAGLYVLLR